MFADIDDLPRPTGADVRNFDGACFDATGERLYAVMRGSNAPGSVYPATTWLVARWPYPSLDSYEIVVESPGAVVAYPCVVGTDIYWLSAELELRGRAITGSGTGSLIAQLDDHTTGSGGQGYWSVRHYDGRLWIPYYRIYGPDPTFDARTGLLEVDIASGAVANHIYSDAPDPIGPHLYSFFDMSVADDGGMWAQVYDNAGLGFDRIARYDPGTDTWATSDLDTYSFQVAAPAGTGGKVRVWDRAVTLPRIVAPDLSVEPDPCGDSFDLWPGAWVAWTENYSTVLWQPDPNDKLMAISCTAGGWRVGSVGFG